MSQFILILTEKAMEQLNALAAEPSKSKVHKAVLKTLGLMQTNLRHPGLNTHEWESEVGPYGGKLWEAYAQNKTPGAYRIFFGYGPKRGEITVTSIEPHP